MTIVMNPSGAWQEVAVFEVASDGADAAVNAFIGRFDADIDHDRKCDVRPAEKCPQGCRWFAARIDFSIGEWRSLHLAAALVRELDHAHLVGYRLIAGREWIDLATMERRRNASTGGNGDLEGEARVMPPDGAHASATRDRRGWRTFRLDRAG